MPSVDEIIAVNEERHRNRRALQNQATPILDFSEVNNNENQPTSNNALIVSLERNLELSNQNSKAISLELQNSIKEKLFVKNAIIQNAIISNLPITQPPVNTPTTPVETNVPNSNEKEQSKFLKTLSDYFLKPTRGNSTGSLLREGGSSFILSALGLGGVDKAFNLSQKFANADLSFGNVKKKVSGATGLIYSGADYITSRFSSVDKTKDENEKEDENRREHEREDFQRFQENNNKKDDSFLPLLVSALLGGISLIGGLITAKITNFFSFFKPILNVVETTFKMLSEGFLKSFEVIKNVLSKTWKVISEGLLKSFEGIGKVFKSVKDEIFKVPELINKGFEASKTMFSTVGEWLGKGKDFFSKGIQPVKNILTKGVEATKGVLKGAGKLALKLPGTGLVKAGYGLGKTIGGMPLQTFENLYKFYEGEVNAKDILGTKGDASVQDMYLSGGLNAGINLANLPNSLSSGVNWLTMGTTPIIPKTINKTPVELQKTISGTFDTAFGNYDTPETTYGNNEKSNNPPNFNIPNVSASALNLADFAKKNQAGESLGQCYGYVWNAIDKSGLGKGIGSRLDTLKSKSGSGDYLNRYAKYFAEFGDSKEGQGKMWKIPVNPNDKNLGLLPGDVIVFQPAWSAKSSKVAGHIEIVGRPNKQGLMSAYSDYEDTNMSSAKFAFKNGKIRGVYRLKDAYKGMKTQLASKKPNVKKPPSKPPIKMASKPTNKIPTNQQLTEHEYGANGSSAVQEKTVNLSNNDPVINISQAVDSAKSSIEPQLKATENINDVRNYQGNNNSIDFSAFVESQNSFNSSILKMLPTLGGGTSQNNNLQMSQTFSGEDPFFAIIQSFL